VSRGGDVTIEEGPEWEGDSATGERRCMTLIALPDGGGGGGGSLGSLHKFFSSLHKP